MPIDPRIPLGIEYPPIASPLESAERVARLRTLPMLARRQELDLEAAEFDARERRQQFADEAQTRQAYEGAGGNLAKALPKLPYKQRLVLEQTHRKQRLDALDEDIKPTEARTKRTDYDLKQFDYIARMANELLAIEDPKEFAQGYVDGITGGLAKGLFGETLEEADSFIAQVPKDGNDPEIRPALEQFIKRLKAASIRGMTAQQAAQYQLDLERHKLDLERHNLVMTKERRAATEAELKSRGEQLEYAARVLGAAQNDAQYQISLDHLRKTPGIGGAVFGMIPMQFDPETTPAVIQALGMTAAQRAANEASGFGTRKPYPSAVEAQRTRIARSTAAARSSGTTGGAADTPQLIAQAIIDGKQPPTTQGLYRFGAPVRAELARKGYDLTTAQKDWQAVQKHLATLNGPQQERLRQAITFTYDSLDVIESLFDEWQQKGGAYGVRLFNKAALATSKQLPGEMGATAQSLEAQINDLVSELGTVYKGGNASTDETLRLAAENLRADWNTATFKKALGLIRKNLQLRRNSILASEPAGVSEGSPYAPKRQEPPASNRPPLDKLIPR